MEFGEFGGIMEPAAGAEYELSDSDVGDCGLSRSWLLGTLCLHNYTSSADPIMTLVELTCPVVLASIHFQFGVSLYWSLVANAVTYAFVGLIVESLRRQHRHAS